MPCIGEWGYGWKCCKAHGQDTSTSFVYFVPTGSWTFLVTTLIWSLRIQPIDPSTSCSHLVKYYYRLNFTCAVPTLSAETKFTFSKRETVVQQRLVDYPLSCWSAATKLSFCRLLIKKLEGEEESSYPGLQGLGVGVLGIGIHALVVPQVIIPTSGLVLL